MASEECEQVAAGDFNPGAWHDRGIWGLRWHTGDGEGDWTSEFEIQFDSILHVERSDEIGHYHVAPAKLVFADVTDLRLRVDNWAHSADCRATLQSPMIHTIERTAIQAGGDAPYYGWQVVFAMPPEGEVTFGASGYVETVLAKGMHLVNRWVLTDDERTRLLGA